MNIIGCDEDGITEISLENLEQIALSGKILEKIEISKSLCSFIFKDYSIYNASGFNIGYSGEGPRGLYKIIKLFYPDKIENNFNETVIPKLNKNKNWNWSPEKGFI